MVEQGFGGRWTERKLQKVREYLPAYMKILAGKGFATGYIDAFAGTGYRTLRKSCPEEPGLFDDLDDSEVEKYRDGSARIALETSPPFNKYVFIEKDSEKCRKLEEIKAEYPELASTINIRNGDANTEIAAMCAPRVSWKKHRAVMFLDPFGMQVSWDTIRLIAATKAIDLWYLFPVGAVNRLLEKKPASIRNSRIASTVRLARRTGELPSTVLLHNLRFSKIQATSGRTLPSGPSATISSPA